MKFHEHNIHLITKGDHTPVERRWVAYLSHIGLWAGRWIDHWVCDAWPVRCQTYGYLPSRRTSPPLGRYQIILLGDRGTQMWTACSELLASNALAGSRTCNLSITGPIPYHYPTEPPWLKYTREWVVFKVKGVCCELLAGSGIVCIQ